MIAPFGRIGGKSKIAKKLIDKFPPLEWFQYYVEPFVGAGNVFFRKPYIEGQIEVINDLDPDVYKVMKALKTRNKYINDNFNRKIDKDYFDSIKHKNDALSTLEKIKTSFFGQNRSFSYRDKEAKTHFVKTDFTPYKERLKNTIILNESFEKVIKAYDSDRTFFYLDPPYESDKEDDYNHYITPEQVYEALLNIKGFFMLSYNDSPKIRKIFKGYRIRSITTTYRATQYIESRIKKEVYITNY
jgi:DNA adenine methylase